MTAPVAPPPNPADIQARYGFVGQMAKSVPEINNILQQAMREQWTTDRFLMTVANTNWWKTNGQAVREWQVLEATDPQTARDRKGHITGDLYARASKMGISLTPQQAEQAFYFTQFSGGMSEENINNYLARTYFDPYQDWNQLHGQAAEIAQQISDTGWAYGWRDFDHYDDSRRMLKGILSGEDSAEGFGIKMRAYAKAMYPGFANEIEGGMTVRDIAAPYIDRQAELLETSKTGIDLKDPLLNKALQARGADGAPAPMAIWQYEQQVRQDPRWAKTNNAKDSMAQFLGKLGKDWGYTA